MLPIMRRPRIFWAWTLTLTAALLAVVWVASMRTELVLSPIPSVDIGWSKGWMLLEGDENPSPYHRKVEWHVRDRLRVRWWFSWYMETDRFGIAIPPWPFVLLTGVPGVWMLIKSRKHTNPHACPACGYDRTGLPQTPTGPAPCPECGKR